jgi:hypothetical protein
LICLAHAANGSEGHGQMRSRLVIARVESNRPLVVLNRFVDAAFGEERLQA